MIARRKDMARLQSTFYHDQYHRMLNVCMFLVAIMVMLIVAIIYVELTHKPAKYYINTTDGKIYDFPQKRRI